MIYTTEEFREELYSESTSASQSRLKIYTQDGIISSKNKSDKELFYKEYDHFIIGSGVDDLLTRGREIFDKKYYKSNFDNKPSEKIMSIVQQIFTIFPEKELDECDKEIIQACKEHNYQANWTNEQTKINKIYKEGLDYFKHLKKAKGRQVISEKEYSKITTISNNLKNHSYTCKYFEDGPDVDIHFQVDIYWEYFTKSGEPVQCKSLLDMVRINHYDKTIRPIDIKTMGGDTINFVTSLRKRRYDFQAAFYTEALIRSDFAKQLGLKDYKILPFKFLVESTTSPGIPLCFTIDNSLLSLGKWGRKQLTHKLGNYVVKVPKIYGFDECINLYHWHNETGNKSGKRIINSKGELTIDWYGII